MSRPSKLTKEQWEQVRQAMIAGVDSKKLAFEFGIAPSTIRDRASLEKWPIPNRIEEIKEQHKALKNIPSVSVNEVKSGEIIAETLQERGLAYGLNVFNRVSELAQKALPVLPTPDNWKAFQIADTIARRAAGMDRPGNTEVKVNLAMFGGSSESTEQGWRVTEQAPD